MSDGIEVRGIPWSKLKHNLTYSRLSRVSQYKSQLDLYLQGSLSSEEKELLKQLKMAQVHQGDMEQLREKAV